MDRINIQAILARHYLYRRDLGITDSVDSTYLVTDNIDEEIESFTSIFNEVFITKRSDGTPINVQLGYAKAQAYIC